MTLNRLFIGFLLFAGLFSCDNEINIAADSQNIPVVFALVDAGEDFNYFRIERAVLDSEISPEILVLNPDSIFYGPEVQARITNLRNNQEVVLERVNLEEEGFVREDGPFIVSPNIGYKLNIAALGLDVNDELSFQLLGPNEQVFTEATTTVVGAHEVGSQPANPLRFRYERELALTLRSNEQAAVFYDLRMFINYTEENDNTGVIENKTLEWLIESELERGRSSVGDFQTQTTFRIEDGEEFYQFLAANIAVDDLLSRKLTSITLQYDAGGQELFDFINIGQANTGITSGQIIPSFTNLTNNAVGLFSSRRTTLSIEEYRLDTEASDSLRDSRLTGPLNFQ